MTCSGAKNQKFLVAALRLSIYGSASFLRLYGTLARKRKYYNFVKFKKSLPASFGAVYIQVSEAKQLRQKEKENVHRAGGRLKWRTT